MPTHHLKISGKVQGVFYRASAKKIALSLGLVGWVKNTADENVELMVTGLDESIEAFESWCRMGPQKAEVEEVLVTKVPDMVFEGFEILR